MKKKVLAALMAATMIMSMGACGTGSSSGNSDSKDTGSESQGETKTASKDALRFMNTKIEIDAALQEFAKQYQEETGSCC